VTQFLPVVIDPVVAAFLVSGPVFNIVAVPEVAVFVVFVVSGLFIMQCKVEILRSKISSDNPKKYYWKLVRAACGTKLQNSVPPLVNDPLHYH